MKKLTLVLTIILLSLIPAKTFSKSFTKEEVSKHNTPNDCYVIFEDKVYDITDYLDSHDRFLDIRSWCGGDMTLDFKTKAGIGRDHKKSTYRTLENYYIGDLVPEKRDSSVTISPEAESKQETQKSSHESEGSKKGRKIRKTYVEKLKEAKYLLLTFSVILLFAWILEKVLIKSKNKKICDILITKRKLFWNLLLLFLSIPSIIFGIFLTLRLFFDELYNIQFDFLFWHVFGSTLFSEVAIFHVIDRIWFFKAFLGKKVEK